MRIHTVILLMVLAPPLMAQHLVVASSTSAPESLDNQQAAPLINLARSAMLDFLKNRTPADRQEIPTRLAGLQNVKCGVAVGIRIEGQLKAQAFASDKTLCRNIIAASLGALRSPSLPDRVTPELIQSATLEIETIENLSAVGSEQIEPSYAQGLTGLLLKAGGREAFSLPSAAYEYGLMAAQAQARCKVQLPQAQLPAAKWFLFSSRHCVGYANGKAIWLFRGKAPIPANFDAHANTLAAAQIGLYLQTHQDKDGCFRAGGARATLSEHLYAAYAMSRLANLASERYDARRALKYAQGLARKADNLTYLASEDPLDQLLSAGFYILASAEAGIEKDDLRDELARTIAARMAMPQLPARMDGAASPAGTRTALCIAARALAGSTDKAAKLLIDRAAAAAPDSAMSALWKSWAGLGLAQVPPEMALKNCASQLPDEQGGLCTAQKATPQTLVAALAALTLLRQVEQAQLDRKTEDEAQLRRQLQAAQWFCTRMSYQPDEAYFAADSADWIGAVRVSPDSAAVNVRTCAAAIEALLAK